MIVAALQKAIDRFQACDDKPTIIIVRSIIGWGAPNKQNTHGAHGAPLGWDEVELAKESYGFPEDEKFHVPDGVSRTFCQQRRFARRGCLRRPGQRHLDGLSISQSRKSGRVASDVRWPAARRLGQRHPGL